MREFSKKHSASRHRARGIVRRLVGRKLDSRYEVVHHVDGDPTNNDPSNLQLLTKHEHQSLHAALRIIDVHHCGKGHKLEGPNLYERPNGTRECVTCRNAQPSRHTELLRQKKHKWYMRHRERLLTESRDRYQARKSAV
jgi:hypothetical protein